MVTNSHQLVQPFSGGSFNLGYGPLYQGLQTPTDSHDLVLKYTSVAPGVLSSIILEGIPLDLYDLPVLLSYPPVLFCDDIKALSAAKLVHHCPRLCPNPYMRATTTGFTMMGKALNVAKLTP
jgi:hypothetical protein